MSDILENFTDILENIGIDLNNDANIDDNCDVFCKNNNNIKINDKVVGTSEDEIKCLENEIFGKQNSINHKNSGLNHNEDGCGNNYKKHDDKMSINIQSGHRRRARERFLKNPEETSDYDLLELILFLIIPRVDTKPMAKKLIDKYGNLLSIFTASVDELNTLGVNGSTFNYLKKLFLCVYRRILKQKMCIKNNQIVDMRTLVEYCRAQVGLLNSEEFHIIFFNSVFHLIEDRKFGLESVSSVSFSLREITQCLLSNGAKNIVLYHNHPNGDAIPSREDIVLTENVINFYKNIDVDVVDHIVITANGYYSFHENDLM